MKLTCVALTLTTLALAAGCGSDHPARFSTLIDNPWMPLAPGSRWVYRMGGQRDVVDVLSRTKVLAGVRARVVHDVATQRGRVIENTYDWFAQDRRGNVWYLGEATKEFPRHGPPSTKGSWQAGVKHAQPGIVMPAHPRVGQSYRQEYLKGEAEDRARVVGVGRRVATRETTPLEPGLVEHKYYARNVGNVLTIATDDPRPEKLVSFHRGRF
jgi:hypothetical protein